MTGGRRSFSTSRPRGPGSASSCSRGMPVARRPARRSSVHAGGRVIHRQVKGGGSYLSANDPRLLIGLGTAMRIDRIDVHWINGERTVVEGPRLEQTLTLREPGTDPPASVAREASSR